MVEPVGFIEAWKAQFPDSEPPKMELRSIGGIEQELEKCKASIRRLEQEVNKERFRMIYLQTLLAKERKSYDKQRWGAGGYADLPSDPKDKLGMGLGVAALRSNFERIKRQLPPPPPPFYTNMEFHHERGLVRVNDRDVSDKISSLGTQAMQMERKRSLHSLPGNLATVAGELRARPVYRGRSTESTCGYDAEYEDGEPNQRHSGRANGGKPPPPPWQPSEFQAYSSVYVGGVMMGEGGSGDGRGGGSGIAMRDHSGGDDHLLTWPRRSYSPGSFEDAGGGGGYTPDCSSNENLTSSEEDFSSGQSSHVSPSPTTAFRRPFREKSRSPSQNSQNSQHSYDSSSPPTPQSQKRHHRQQGGHVVMSEATIVSVRKTGQIWPPPVHHDLLFHGDHLEYPVFCCLPLYKVMLIRAK
uniref:Bcr-Abl oncoprotein oligomerisation domain-containing protein n=1 Tax=Xiphophorus couchianus TaxID=32473 RepID=A0A3B5L5T9_9TELE